MFCWTIAKYRIRSSRQKASLDSKWLVKDPCGTPAARTMSRTVAPQYPCSSTTLKPSVSIFSRSDGLGIETPYAAIAAGLLNGQHATTAVRNQIIHVSLFGVKHRAQPIVGRRALWLYFSPL